MKRQMEISKKVGSAIYVHRDYTHKVFPDEVWNKTLNCFYDGHYYTQWDIAKWDSRKDTLSFIFCNDFDVDPEPSIRSVITLHLDTMKRSMRFYGDSMITVRKNPPIYHHKWLFVGDGYRKFNVSSAKKRSEEIEKIIVKHRIDKKRIGYKNYWVEHVLPHL